MPLSLRNSILLLTFFCILFAVSPATAQHHASENIVEVKTLDGSDFPSLIVNGDQFDPSGWVGSKTLSSGFGTLRKEMDKCMRQGYECFVLRIDWPAIEPVSGGIKTDTLQKLLTHADTIGLKIIIALEVDTAPDWFIDRFPEAVMVTRYPDKQLDVKSGAYTRESRFGKLDLRSGQGVIGFHWPDSEYKLDGTPFYQAMRLFWEDSINILKNQLEDHICFLGWAINTPVSPNGYHGGGVKGIMGISDYSDARRELFYASSGGMEAPDPLPRYTQANPDVRDEWLEFSRFRIRNRRNFLDFVGNQIKTADPYHPVFLFPGEILSYANDNGYLAEAEALDWGYYLRKKYIDGVILPTQLTSNTFASGFHPGEGELVTLQAAVGAAINHRKLPLVWVEKGPSAPSKADLQAFASLLHVWGAYPLYSQPLRYIDSDNWGSNLTRVIEAFSFLSLLPPPKKRQLARVAILDYPYHFGKFYAEKGNILKTACIQLEVLNQAGIPFDIVDIEEVRDYPQVLGPYRVVMPLAGSLWETEAYLESDIENVLDNFRQSGGFIYHPIPIKLKEFAQGDYSDTSYVEETRVEFVRFGCGANQVSSADVTTAVAQPYIFLYPQRHRYNAYLNAHIENWTTGGMDILYFLEVLNGRKLTADVFTYLARMDLDLFGGRPYLFTETRSVIDVIDQVKERRSVISARQTEEAMRKFVPVSLAVCFIMLLLLAFYSLHGSKERLQQKAIRIGGSHHLEEFDVVELQGIKRRSFLKDLESTEVLKRIIAAAGLGEMGAEASEALPILRSKIHDEEDEYVKKAMLDAISKIEGYA